MKFLRILIVVIIVLAAAVLIAGAILPAKVSVKAEREIFLSPQKIFYSLATFSNRMQWDPWAATDSTATAEFSLKDGYVGSTYSWNGEIIKTGSETIDSVGFGSYIRSSLNFNDGGKPAKAEWILNPTDAGTMVTWQFEGEGAYPVERIFLNLFKKSMQKSFTDGLENLKKLLEEKGVSMHKLSGYEVLEVPGFNSLVAEASGTMNEVVSRYPALFQASMDAVAKQGLAMEGYPFSYSFNYDPVNNTTSVYCGVPVNGKPKADGMVKPFTVKPFKALKVTFSGPYEEFTPAYQTIMAYMEQQKLESAWTVFEFYITDPMAEPDPSKWLTDIYMVLK